MSAWADTETVSYIDADGVEKTVTATVIDAKTPNNTSDSFPAGWYVVTEDVKFTSHIKTTGEIHLILADGKTMTVTVDGTAIHLGGDLTIYGQSLGTGKLIANGSQCGISSIYNADNVTISGGIVTATGDGDAGISADNVTLGGGIVTASSYRGTVNLTCGYRTADGTTIASGDDIANGVYNGKTIYPAVAVSYLDEHGVERTVPSKDYTILEGTPGDAYLNGGTYVVCSNITYTSTVSLDDDVTLILADGCRMNIGTSESRISGKGINGDCQSLTIYGQTLGTGASFYWVVSASAFISVLTRSPLICTSMPKRTAGGN